MEKKYLFHELNTCLNGKVDAYIRSGRSIEDLYNDLKLNSPRYFNNMLNGYVMATSNFINRLTVLNREIEKESQ